MRNTLIATVLLCLSLNAYPEKLEWSAGPITADQLIPHPEGGIMTSSGGNIGRIGGAEGTYLWQTKETSSNWFPKASSIIPVNNSPYAMSWDTETLKVIDLKSGAILWKHSDDEPIVELDGLIAHLPIADTNMVLLIAHSWFSNITTIVAVDMVSGKKLWKSEEILQRQIDKDKNYFFNALHPPIYDGEGVVLFLDDSGPIKFDPANGKILWRTVERQKALFGSGTAPGHLGSPNWYHDGTAPMFVEGDKFYAIVNQSVYQFDLKTGKKDWVMSRHRKEDLRLRGFQMTEKGLLLYGYTYEENQSKDIGADLIDLETGEYVWDETSMLDSRKKRFKDGFFGSPTKPTFAVAGDRLYIAKDLQLKAIDLKTGNLTDIVSLEHGGKISRVEVVEGNILLSSPRFLTMVSAQGELFYHHKYPAPEKSLMQSATEGLGRLALSVAVDAALKEAQSRTNSLETAVQLQAAREQNADSLYGKYSEMAKENYERQLYEKQFVYFYVGSKEHVTERKIVQVEKKTGDTVNTFDLGKQGELKIRYYSDMVDKRLYVKSGSSLMAFSY